jgi:hypothetical protein
MYTMKRCLFLWGLATAVLAAPAIAQDLPQRIPPMAANALRGEMVVTLPPDIVLNGQPARLSPGARIRGRNNLLLLSGTLVGQTLQVRYLPDTSGLVHQVWILNDVELQAKP